MPSVNYYSDEGYPLLLGLPVDICIFTILSESRRLNEETKTRTDLRTLRSLPRQWLGILLIKRDDDTWALPGGFTKLDSETLDQAAVRVLKTEANLEAQLEASEDPTDGGVYIEQFKAYYSPERDPRGWTPTVAYAALVNQKLLQSVKPGGDVKETGLFQIHVENEGHFTLVRHIEGPPLALAESNLAFDHDMIIRNARKFIEHKVLTTTIARALLPAEFTIAELYNVLSTAVLGFERVSPNFARDILKSKSREAMLELAVDEKGNPVTSQEYSARPAKTYRFNPEFKQKVSIYPGSL